MKNISVLLVVLAIGILPCFTGNAQVYKFKQYNSEKNKLSHDFIYDIVQDKYGYMWFATGMGVCRYDGFRFLTPSDACLPANNATTAFKDSTGNLWFGYNDGLVVKYNGFKFSIADTSLSKASINQIIQAPGGEILVATQSNGVTRITGKQVEYLSQGLEEKIIYSMCYAGKDKLLLGCQDGLYLYNYQPDKKILTPVAKADSIGDATINAIVPQAKGNGYWVATEENGIFHVSVHENNFATQPLSISLLEDIQIKSVYDDGQNYLWISTFLKGLFRIHVSNDLTIGEIFNYNSTNGLGSDYVKRIFFDNQQDLWVGTYGQGVASITNLAFSFFESINAIGNNAMAISSVDKSEYWVAGIGTIVRFITKPEPSTIILGRANGIPNDKIIALHQDEKGNLWIGTEKNGLYKLPKDANMAVQFFWSQNSLANSIQAITSQDGKIWFASRGGAFEIDAQNGSVEQQFNTNSELRLPHNNIRDIYKDSKGIIWIATNSNSIISVNSNKKYTLEDAGEIEFTSLTEDSKGRIWAGTNGMGVFLFNQNDSTYHFTVKEGLKSEYCYSIIDDGNGNVWVGHRQGLSRINTNHFGITTFGPEMGLSGDANNNAMQVNRSGELLVGMTNGVMKYDINADRKRDQAPMLNLSEVMIGDEKYDPYKPAVLPAGYHKVRFDFIGLQFADPESVTYQYKLLDYDTDFSSPSTSRSVTYSRLEDGEYKLLVKACGVDNCTEETMLFVIKIKKPFWKTWWFITLVVGAVIGVVYVIIMIRERNHRIQQEYLERELAARTKEVRVQKEEIEAKNRDITDSINYAQRIQFSVLPSTSTLLEHCAGAFIFYRPRDIVSGDFYWFDYFPETNRLMIVCADSTGHGVPGAFMSLIGTTLIKDIALRPDVENPADILYRLDENIQSTLNQNQESEHANDGMDLVVCEVNTETKFVRIASAMRPFIIYHDGEPTVYKSSRASIGGQATKGKVFEVNEIQLSSGDEIYMFTDGYADQFGGPSGKKFKMNRLQSILDDVHTRDMEEQHRVIKENFDLWKGSLSQIDDVLMIGIRL